MKFLISALIAFAILSCSRERIDYAKYKASQDYSVPLFKNSYKSKVALFIFPHPDDEIVCGGAMTQLKKEGWSINLLTLTKGQSAEKTTRTKEWANALRILALDHQEILDLPNNSWDNVMNDNIEFWYSNIDSLENIIKEYVRKLKPTLLFTYDTALGAYGHPEHRVSALAAVNLFKKHEKDSTFSVKEILQITLPEKQEKLMLGASTSYKNAIQRTGNKTLPDPTVAFDISPYWTTKRTAASQYESQASTLRKFFLLPNITDTTEHYKTFDREYYFEIE